jgi:hypothetical protein
MNGFGFGILSGPHTGGTLPPPLIPSTSLADAAAPAARHEKTAADDSNPTAGGANPAVAFPNPAARGANPTAAFPNPTAGGAPPAVTFPPPIIGFAPRTVGGAPPTIGFAPIFVKNGPFSLKNPFSRPKTPFHPLWGTTTNCPAECPRSGASITEKTNKQHIRKNKTK